VRWAYFNASIADAIASVRWAYFNASIADAIASVRWAYFNASIADAIASVRWAYFNASIADAIASVRWAYFNASIADAIASVRWALSTCKFSIIFRLVARHLYLQRALHQMLQSLCVHVPHLASLGAHSVVCNCYLVGVNKSLSVKAHILPLFAFCSEALCILDVVVDTIKN
jgi:hypothetical protein